nr:hypothetical protein [Tanacetum cinerariifolium]
MDSLSPQVVYAAKLPILNPNEFDLWKMRIEQYFLMTDYSLWEVIFNGDSLAPTRVVEGVLQLVAPTTAEQKLARKNELKARGTLPMALLDKHPLKFNSHKDAKTLMKAIEKRFRGTIETKKVQKILLKQQYENFTCSSLESLDQIHDRLQKLVSQLEIHKVTTESVSAAASVSAIYAKMPVSSLPNGDSLSNAGHFARECRSPKDSRRNRAAEPQRRNVLVETFTSNALVSQCDGVGSHDWSFQVEEEPANYALMAFSSSSSSSDIEVVSCSKAYAQLYSQYDKLTADFHKSQFNVISYQIGLEAIEARLLVYKQTEFVFEEDIKLLKLEVLTRAMFDCDDYLSSESDESWPPSSLYDRSQPSDGPTKLAQDLSHTNRPIAPIIEDRVSDSEDESETKALQIILSFVQSTEQVQTPRPSIHHVETSILIATPKPASPKTTITTDVPKFKVSRPRHSKPIVTKINLPTRRHITHSPFLKSNNLPLRVTAVKAPMGCPQYALKDKGVINSGCSRHMTGNMSYLSEFEEFNGGYVSFGGNPKGGKISGKEKIRTGKLDFDDVYFLKELKFNLFSVLQIFLGKFEGKVDEGFLVGYSVNSKAFRAFNSRTRIVQDTLHVNFLENKHNVAGSGCTWLFDIDRLTRTINYQPVTTGNQSNPSVGFQDKFDAEKEGEKIDKQFVLFPVWSSGSTNTQKTDGDAAFDGKKHEFDKKKPESNMLSQGKEYIF